MYFIMSFIINSYTNLWRMSIRFSSNPQSLAPTSRIRLNFHVEDIYMEVIMNWPNYFMHLLQIFLADVFQAGATVSLY